MVARIAWPDESPAIAAYAVADGNNRPTTGRRLICLLGILLHPSATGPHHPGRYEASRDLASRMASSSDSSTYASACLCLICYHNNSTFTEWRYLFCRAPARRNSPARHRSGSSTKTFTCLRSFLTHWRSPSASAIEIEPERHRFQKAVCTTSVSTTWRN